jgi:hypothetical protein
LQSNHIKPGQFAIVRKSNEPQKDGRVTALKALGQSKTPLPNRFGGKKSLCSPRGVTPVTTGTRVIADERLGEQAHA